MDVLTIPDAAARPAPAAPGKEIAEVQKVRDVLTSRWLVKGAFLAFFTWSCVRLLQFASWASGEGPYVPRPESVGGILPIGHFTSFFAWLRGGGWDTYLPAGLVIIIGAMATSLALKRGFCGWICPVGTVWEAASAAGRRLLGRNFVLWRPLDLVLRGLRYLLAAAAIALLLSVPVAEAVDFRTLPYMWTADIRIVRMMGESPFITVALVTLLVSMLIGPVWCRYLCPLGGIYSALGVASPCTVYRRDELCVHCHRCDEVCHAFVHVEARSGSVRAPECDGCMDCVKACPAAGCLTARAFGRVEISAWVWPVLVVGLWLWIYAVAKLTGNWDTGIPIDALRQVVGSGILETQTPGFF